MTKIKHPTNREERLKLKHKYEKSEVKERYSGRIRRKLKERTKDQETADELREDYQHINF